MHSYPLGFTDTWSSGVTDAQSSEVTDAQSSGVTDALFYRLDSPQGILMPTDRR